MGQPTMKQRVARHKREIEELMAKKKNAPVYTARGDAGERKERIAREQGNLLSRKPELNIRHELKRSIDESIRRRLDGGTT